MRSIVQSLSSHSVDSVLERRVVSGVASHKLIPFLWRLSGVCLEVRLVEGEKWQNLHFEGLTYIRSIRSKQESLLIGSRAHSNGVVSLNMMGEWVSAN